MGPARQHPCVCETEDWRVGDMAECVHDHPWLDVFGRPGCPGPVLGEVRQVREVLTCPVTTDQTAQFLSFDRYPTIRYSAGCFRKVTPRADELIAAEPSIVERWLPDKIAARMPHVTAALVAVTFALVFAPAIATALQGLS